MSGASCLYEGHVRHRRMGRVAHEFRYPIFMPYLDLDELPAVLDGHALWSARRPAPAWFRRADYLGDPLRPLAESVRELVAERIGERPAGPVRLLAHLRYFGHCFNPVSFYYCFDASGERVRAVVAEVTNTPWGERHSYVMDTGDTAPGAVMRQSFAKVFHVSPFMGMDHRYEWRLTQPGESLSVHIESRREGAVVFDATVGMRRHALTGPTLNRVLARYPLETLRVLGRIYGHAARLKLKGAPYHPHPGGKPAVRGGAGSGAEAVRP